MHLLSQYRGLRRENYILVLGRMVTSLGSMIWPVMTMILNQKLGFSATQVAAYMVIAGLVQMPLGLWGGKLADRYSKKQIIVICDSLSVLFFLTCAFLPLSGFSVVMLFLGALLQSMEGPAYETLVADLTPTADREKAYSLVYMGANVGMIASPTIAGFLFVHHLNLSFAISGCAIALSTILIFFFIHDTSVAVDETEEGTYQKAEENASIFEVLGRNKVMLLYTFMIGLFWCAYGQNSFLLPLDMARLHGDRGAVMFGSITSLNCIIVVLCTPVITSLFEKTALTVKNLIGIVLVTAAYGIFLLGMGHVPVYYLAMIFFTLGEIFATICSGPYMTERVPASHRGRMNSVMTVITTIIGNVGMLLTGLFYDNLAPAAGWIFVLGMLVVAIFFNVILIPLDRKRYRKLYP